MAYQTGTVLSLNETYDALISFMTANGWSLYDNIPITGSRDKVLYSAGTDGKMNMYYRISSNEFGNPYKDPTDAQVRFPYIFVRGYHNWNPTTHSGSGEFGVMGPILWGGQQYSNTTNHYWYPFQKANGTLAVPLEATVYRYNLFQSGFGVQTLDSRRRAISAVSTGIAFADFATAEVVTVTNGNLSNANNNGCAVYRDPTTDREYVYVMSYNDSSNFFRYDVESNVWATLPAPPWGVASAGGSQMVFDGVDTIYMVRGQSTTTFAKYKISTNSWTSLATLPVAMPNHLSGNGQTTSRMIYVPASATGLAEDVIYAVIADSGTTIYRYDVTSNVWRTTTGTGASTAPAAVNAQTNLTWDASRYMFFWQPNLNSVYRADLSAGPGLLGTGAWSTLGTLDTGNRILESAVVVNHITSKIRCNNVIPGKYFFHGDADSIRVVVRIGSNPGNGRYYWSYMGKYDTNYRTEIMKITGPVSSGVRVTVPVDSTSGYNDGQEVIFMKWSGSFGESHLERSTIYQITGPDSFVCNLTSSFSSGSSVGVDPSQQILTGDCGIGVAPHDSVGYWTKHEPAWYNITPSIALSTADRLAPSTRGTYLPVPFWITNGQLSTNNRYEILGYLKNVFAHHKKDFPAPQNEDTLVIGDDTYIFFNVQEMQRNSSDTRGIVIGPI